MLRLFSKIIVIAAFAMVDVAYADETKMPHDLVAPKNAVEGIRQGRWSTRWWQWAASFDDDESPIADRTGDLCASEQRGSVWFLAGVFGSAPVKRTCTVPRGKYLFFPIINYMVQSLPDDPMTCATMTNLAKELTDGATNLTLIIDGEEFHGLEDLRQVSSGCFNLLESVGGRRDAAANGYFAMLKPLKPGRHTLKWGGMLESMRQAVVYEITVL